ncbi:hypothetical protein MTR67_052845 [Solanum verrucosum]|uniref:Uncharacterized protein n=1 Tax=Solanum verrucosum TaxID=315347 RepID=A0AAF0V7M3_SOLVR|nr:hypothetical protein MTR67_052845 [Solanum verrucosum]
MRLGIFEKREVLVSIEVNLTFIDKIKTKQLEDEELAKIKCKVVSGRPKRPHSMSMNEDSPTDSPELKIGNRSKRDLDAENLNLHHEKM